MLDARKMVNGYQEIRESGSRGTGDQVIRGTGDLIEDLDPSTHSATPSTEFTLSVAERAQGYG